jgi:hypothetical protein
MAKLTPAADTSTAEWIVAALRTFGESVLSLVPAGFSTYVRLFHPAYRHAADGLKPLGWADVADANGTRAHAAMQLITLTGSPEYLHAAQPGVYDLPPREGSLPPELVEPLIAVLARRTTTPDRCWFAVWNGFGATRADVRSAPTFHLPGRDYHLLAGPIGAVAESVLDQPGAQSPNLWWPADHAWCVATEIDLNTTYIGCDEACRDEILSVAELEAAPIDRGAGISWRSDPVNPWPGE